MDTFFGILVEVSEYATLNSSKGIIRDSATKQGVLAQWLASRTTDQGVPGSRPGRSTACCGLEQVTITHCLVLVKPRKPWTDD